jgi:hypothetical protein
MTRRILAFLPTIGVALVAAVMSVQNTTAQSAAPAPHASASWTLDRHLELVRTLREHLGVAATWTPRRTAWGHPDFEGRGPAMRSMAYRATAPPSSGTACF